MPQDIKEPVPDRGLPPVRPSCYCSFVISGRNTILICNFRNEAQASPFARALICLEAWAKCHTSLQSVVMACCTAVMSRKVWQSLFAGTVRVFAKLVQGTRHVPPPSRGTSAEMLGKAAGAAGCTVGPGTCDSDSCWHSCTNPPSPLFYTVPSHEAAAIVEACRKLEHDAFIGRCLEQWPMQSDS